jgi:hypothetical protein
MLQEVHHLLISDTAKFLKPEVMGALSIGRARRQKCWTSMARYDFFPVNAGRNGSDCRAGERAKLRRFFA